MSAIFRPTAHEIPAVILAGGRSFRMGENKALVHLADRTLFERVSQRLGSQSTHVALNGDPKWARQLCSDTVEELSPGRLGPLAGILASMRYGAARRAQYVATVAVDTPFFPRDLLQRLVEAISRPDEIAIAASERDHPTCGLWPVHLADDLEVWLEKADRRSIRDYLKGHRVKTVKFPLYELDEQQLDPFFNINTQDDLAFAETIARSFKL